MDVRLEMKVSIFFFYMDDLKSLLKILITWIDYTNIEGFQR